MGAVPTDVLIWTLTGVATLVVLITRIRVSREGSRGAYRVGNGVLTWHTVFGVLALVAWSLFLVLGEDAPLGDAEMGIIGLALWWLTAMVGVLIMLRWLPAGGRHSGPRSHGGLLGWLAGPGLSVIGHIGLIVVVGIFTWAYVTSAV
jgi:hypothetical protein